MTLYPNNSTKQVVDNELNKKLKKFDERIENNSSEITSLKSRVSNTEDNITSINGDIEGLEEDIDSLDTRVDTVELALDEKQDTLNFDDVPTNNSDNPVKSSGIYDALETKLDKESVKFDPEPNGTDALSTGGAYDIVQDLTEQLNDYKRNVVVQTTDADGVKKNLGAIIIDNQNVSETDKAIVVENGGTELKDTDVDGDLTSTTLAVENDATIGGNATVNGSVTSNEFVGGLEKSISITDENNTVHTFNNSENVELSGVLKAQKDINGDSIDSTYVKNATKGVANGIATLDENGRLPYSQLPESAMELKGLWDASTNTPTLVQGVGTNGDFYIVSVGGTQFGESFNVNDRIVFVSDDNTWHRLPYTITSPVTSVNNKIGAVTLYGTDIAKSSSESETVSNSIDNIVSGSTVVGKASQLGTARSINGTQFDGTSDITTSKWGTKRTITVKDNDGTNSQSNTNIDGSANFDLKLPSTIKATITGSATSAGKLTTARKVYVKLGTASTSETKDFSGDTAIPVDGTLAIANGGTGATSASGARTNLGLGSASTYNAGGGSTGKIPPIVDTYISNNIMIGVSNGIKSSSYSPTDLLYSGNGGAYCTTGISTASKGVTMPGFSLYKGATVKVMFQYGNSVANPTLNVNSTGAKTIKVVRGGALYSLGSSETSTSINARKYFSTLREGGSSNTNVYEMWQPNTTLEFMYDGTYWVIIGNPVVESYYSANNGYSVYADGKIECWGNIPAKVNTAYFTLPIQFSNANYRIFMTTDNDNHKAVGVANKSTDKCRPIVDGAYQSVDYYIIGY